MKKGIVIFIAMVLLVSLLMVSCTTATTTKAPTTTSAATATTAPTAAPSSAAAKPSTTQPSSTTTTAAASINSGGILKIINSHAPVQFGYPPRIQNPDQTFASPCFDTLLSVGEGGVYQPGLALSWESPADGKSITFKLRQGVKFHDGTPFNAQAVKFNFDLLIAPNTVKMFGVTSTEVIDDYTVRINLTNYNNLLLYQIASSVLCYIASPTAIQKNGADWAGLNPVGTGPFMLKSYEKNTKVIYAKNPDYWKKGLPLVDEMDQLIVLDKMTQMVSFKAGEASQIYDVQPPVASQLRDAGYTLLNAPGSLFGMNMDTKSPDSIFTNPKIRLAMEYAMDKESICNGPGLGLYKPLYQIVVDTSPDYNPTCPPRKYDIAKAKQLLAEAGYPNGFSFKASFRNTTWQDGITALQSSLANAGIKMEINWVSDAIISQMLSGKIEKGTAGQISMVVASNNLSSVDQYLHSDTPTYAYMVKPKGIDDLIEQAKSARDTASQIKANQAITKLLYDDETFIPFWVNPRIVVIDKTVQDSGWYINNDSNNNEIGLRTWLKK